MFKAAIELATSFSLQIGWYSIISLVRTTWDMEKSASYKKKSVLEMEMFFYY